jgi:two-component system response regulator RpaA
MSVRTANYKPAILLVDADDDTRELHKLLLNDVASTIEEACDGIEAYGRALSHPPDLVVTEMRLPRMDGRTLIDRLRKDPHLHECGILVVSGSAHGLIRDDLLRAGADEVLPKPCEPDLIVHAVERLAWRLPRPLRMTMSADPEGPAVQQGRQRREVFRRRA